MPSENPAQKYIAEILIAINKLNERNGSKIKSIVDYIRQNLVKNSSVRADVLNQRIKRNLQSAVQLKLLRCANGKYQMLDDIKSPAGIRPHCVAQRGRRRRKSRSPSKRGRQRRRRSRSRRRRRQGGRRRSDSSVPDQANKNSQNEPQSDNDNGDDGDNHNNTSDCVCNL